MKKTRSSVIHFSVAFLTIFSVLLSSLGASIPASAASLEIQSAELQSPANVGVSGDAETPLQQAIKEAIEERQRQGLPVPASITFENDVKSNPEHFSRLTGTTTIHFDHPEQAGLQKWPDLVVGEDLPPGAIGSVTPGDYTETVRETLEEQFPGIWENHEFGYEPRTYTVEEVLEITYPDTSEERLGALHTVAGASSTTDNVVMGFTLPGPDIDYSIHPKWEVCIWPFPCATIAEARAGFVLDWAIGLRLPAEINLELPDMMAQGCSYMPTSALIPLNWAASEFQQAGVPRHEGGYEFILQFEFFVGAWAEILGIRVFDWSLEVDFDKSKSFTTPFGPDAEFPIPTLDLSPSQTGLEWDLFGIASFGIGLKIDPQLGSDKITADWQASHDASGSGDLRYSHPGVPVPLGSVMAGDFSPMDYAQITLSDFRYWFTIFLIKLSGYLEFDLFGYGLNLGSFDIANIDLSGITGGLWLGVHSGTSGIVTGMVPVRPPVEAGPDQVADEGETIHLPPSTFIACDPTKTHTATIDWGDGSPLEDGVVTEDLWTGTVSGSHAYGDNGLYTVEVCVTEEDSYTACDTFEVTVYNVPPTVDAGPDRTISEGDTLDLDPATFTDPGFLDTHTATIDWGDSSPIEPGVVDEIDGSGTVSGSHTYLDDGIHIVQVCVTDDDGGVGCDSFELTVLNVPPDVDAGPDKDIHEGETVTLDMTTFTDPGILDTHTASIDWGDGSPLEDGLVTESMGSGSVTGSHDYGDNGLFTVTIEVCDDDGGCGQDSLEVTVHNLSPDVDLDSSGTKSFAGGEGFLGRKGVEQTHRATATDPGSDDLTFEWSFGVSHIYYNDGVGPDPFPSPDGIFPFEAMDEAEVTFVTPGLHSIEVEVMDDDGGSDSEALPKVVTDDHDWVRGRIYWLRQFSGWGRTIDEDTLQAYLDIVNFVSMIFSEEVPASTIEEARQVLMLSHRKIRSMVEAYVLVAWLNFASGAIDWDQPIDTNRDCKGDTPFHVVMYRVESLLLRFDRLGLDVGTLKGLAEVVGSDEDGLPKTCKPIPTPKPPEPKPTPPIPRPRPRNIIPKITLRGRSTLPLDRFQR